MHVSHRFISAVLSCTFSCIFQFSAFLQKAVGRRRSRSAESSNTRGRTRQEGWAFPSLRRTAEDSKRIPSFLFSCLLFLKSLRPLCCCLSLLSLMCQYAHMLQLLPLFFFHKLNLSLFLSLSLCRDGLSGTSRRQRLCSQWMEQGQVLRLPLHSCALCIRHYNLAWF